MSYFQKQTGNKEISSVIANEQLDLDTNLLGSQTTKLTITSTS